MSNKKIPEGVELMAAVDYNQALSNAPRQETPDSVITEMPQEISQREVSNDVVSIGKQKTSLPSDATQQHDDFSQQDVPADSLSALLNRQVQQPIQVSDSERTQLPESSIEQQLKK